jgi:hypothetical protein
MEAAEFQTFFKMFDLFGEKYIRSRFFEVFGLDFFALFKQSACDVIGSINICHKPARALGILAQFASESFSVNLRFRRFFGGAAKSDAEFCGFLRIFNFSGLFFASNFFPISVFCADFEALTES